MRYSKDVCDMKEKLLSDVQASEQETISAKELKEKFLEWLRTDNNLDRFVESTIAKVEYYVAYNVDEDNIFSFTKASTNWSWAPDSDLIINLHHAGNMWMSELVMAWVSNFPDSVIIELNEASEAGFIDLSEEQLRILKTLFIEMDREEIMQGGLEDVEQMEHKSETVTKALRDNFTDKQLVKANMCMSWQNGGSEFLGEYGSSDFTRIVKEIERRERYRNRE